MTKTTFTGAVLIITATFTVNCTVNNQNDFSYDYLVFGDYHGECLGEHCVNMYKVEGNTLFKDTSAELPTWMHAYQANFYEALPDSLLKTADKIGGLLPEQMLNDTVKVYGEPDAGDWGGYYIEVKYNDKVRYFLLDTKKENIPEILYDFQNEIEKQISCLNAITNE